MARTPVDKKKIAAKRRKNKDLILQALTDPKFRRALQADPKAVTRKGSQLNQREVALVLAAVKGIESQIKGLADELLCLNGPCGIAIG